MPTINESACKLSLLLVFAMGAHGAVHCTTSPADALLIQSVLNSASSGSTITITGTCNLAGAVLTIPSKGLTLTGGAIMNGDGNGDGNLRLYSNTTLSGLTFNNATVAVAGPVATNVQITNNTFRNFITTQAPALASYVLVLSAINNNTFTNIWQGGYFNTTSMTADGSPTAYQNFGGLDHTTISGNLFDMVRNDAIHLGFDYYSGQDTPGISHGAVISDNEFRHVHRIPLEIQGTPDGRCNGPCFGAAGSVPKNTDGLVISGNYVHDPAWPYWNSWGYSIPVDWSTNGQVINNAGIMNNSSQTCAENQYGSIAQTFEISGSNLLVQGNLGAEISRPKCTWSNPAVVAHSGGTDIFQNNVFCGPMATLEVSYEVSDANRPAIVDQYNYRNPASCPAGGNLTTSNIAIAFSSASNQIIPTGGSGTWSTYVISNLPIRRVQFFVDGATSPFATQQVQDVNKNFPADRKWLYHATLNAATLGSGNHTLSAAATDVSGATQIVSQSFVVGAAGTAGAGKPVSILTPAKGSPKAQGPSDPQEPATPVVSSPAALPANLPAGMILWLASDAGVVTTGGGVCAWDDQSGHGNSAVQPNAANQPVLITENSKGNAVRFNGSSSFMSIPSVPVNGDHGMSVFVVSANSSDENAGWGRYALLSWPESAYWGYTFFGSYQTSAHFRFGTTQAGNEPAYRMSFDRGNSFGLSEWMHSGTTDSMWLNGQLVGSYPGKLAEISGVGNTAFVGLGNGDTFYAGDVSEVIVYSRALTVAERQAIEKYLLAKYHL